MSPRAAVALTWRNIDDRGKSRWTVREVGTDLDTYDLVAKQRRALLEAKSWDLVGTVIALGGGFSSRPQVRAISAIASLACYGRSDYYAQVHGRLSDDLDRLVCRLAGVQTPAKLVPAIPGLEATVYQEVLDYTHDLPVAYVALARVAKRDALTRALLTALAGVVALKGASYAAPSILTLRSAHWVWRGKSLGLLKRDATRVSIRPTPEGSARLHVSASASRQGLAGLEVRQRAGQARRMRLTVATVLYAQNHRGCTEP